MMALTTVTAVTISTDVLPLKISPKDGNTSLQFLKKWMAANKDWLDQKLLEHGIDHCKSASKCISCCSASSHLA